MNNPRIYSISRNNKDLGTSALMFYVVSVVWQSLVIFYVPYFSLSVMERFGTGDVASFGIAVFWIYWFIMNWCSIFLTRTWTYVRPAGLPSAARMHARMHARTHARPAPPLVGWLIVLCFVCFVSSCFCCVVRRSCT
jgi:hypothetical protein